MTRNSRMTKRRRRQSRREDGGGLLAEELDNNLAAAGAVVEVDADDLLPHPDLQLAAVERDGDRRSDERSPDVAVAVGVVVTNVVLPPACLGGDILDNGVEVRRAPGLVLDGRDTTRRVGHEHGTQALGE